MVVAANFDLSLHGVLDAVLTLDPDDGVVLVAVLVLVGEGRDLNRLFKEMYDYS